MLENLDGVTLNDDVLAPATLPPDELLGKDWAAAVAAVRGNVLAIATGLAALLAVFYTARNADTARRTFQLGERGHDTDRFSKAVEQLGSGQAPVRLGGLYALEQLAENNPALRQTIVDVICAYLRMPWKAPDVQDRSQQVRAAQRAARTPASGRAQARAGRDPTRNDRSGSPPSVSSPTTYAATGAAGGSAAPPSTRTTGPASASISPVPCSSPSS
ncbi:hypothetical protein ABZ815_19960 [Nonomuraea sp. NPDC047529]|uniref:hypothetical protein n=1 Tax=Nonomuraea sp. NPDC047529 TaxID=3155623 RepID=UPI0033CA79D6